MSTPREFPKKITGERIELRAFEVSQAEQMFEAVDKDRERLRRFLLWVDHTRKVDDEHVFLKMMEEEWARGQTYGFGIFNRENGAYIGSIDAHTVLWRFQRCELGYWIVGAHEGKGYMREAVLLLERELFKAGIKRIEVRCAASNRRSANVPRACGYQLEGVLKADCTDGDQPADSFLFGKILSEECKVEAKSPSGPPQFQWDHYVLRMANLDDAAAIVEFFKKNEAHLAPTDPPKPEGFYTEESWRRRVLRSLDEFSKGESLRLFLFEQGPSPRVIGSVSLTQMVRGSFQACYLGFALDQDRQGQGIMRQALEHTIRHVFEELGFHRIMANHLVDNRRSEGLLVRLGFDKEGVAKDYLQIAGQWRTHVLRARTHPAAQS